MSSLAHYDPDSRRLWLLGQRCHHGALGALMASAAAGAIASSRTGARAALTLAGIGAALMAHDLRDHAVWFVRERG